MEKLYDPIIFKNNSAPDINETNLNRMSKAISDIDDRVIKALPKAVETGLLLDEIDKTYQQTKENVKLSQNWAVGKYTSMIFKGDWRADDELSQSTIINIDGTRTEVDANQIIAINIDASVSDVKGFIVRNKHPDKFSILGYLKWTIYDGNKLIYYGGAPEEVEVEGVSISLYCDKPYYEDETGKHAIEVEVLLENSEPSETNNSKYYADEARNSANEAKAAAKKAEDALNSIVELLKQQP